MNLTFPSIDAKVPLPEKIQSHSAKAPLPLSLHDGLPEKIQSRVLSSNFSFLSVGQAPAPQSICLDAWHAHAAELMQKSGSLVFFGKDQLSDALVEQHDRCRTTRSIHAHYLLGVFSITGYIEASLLRKPDEALSTTLMHLREIVSSEEGSVFAQYWPNSGAGLCVPKVCLKDPEDLRKVAVEMLLILLCFVAARLEVPLSAVMKFPGPDDIYELLVLMATVEGST
eukprot:TRINITY_DN22676_c0_g1_i1.p1 TRINITY_DN22676_c0_g1~~TRINITY_DN22676_c0_g1_i1.p1  ORF type:complete len:226 (-),score=26.04 TRINITY_DN22676_c0_g1_i1:2-679(-)